MGCCVKMSEASLIREFALQHKLDARQISVLKTGAGDEHTYDVEIKYPLAKVDKQEDWSYDDWTDENKNAVVHIRIDAKSPEEADEKLKNIGMVLVAGLYGTP